MVKPKEYADAAKGARGPGLTDRRYLPGQMLRTPQFYMLWLTFAVGGMAGLMVIGIIALFIKDALTATGMEAAQALVIAGTAMGVFFAIANGLGRLVWGSISRPLGRKTSVIIMSAIQGVMMLLFYFVLSSSEWPLYLGAALIGFNFGGNFALFPALTADMFGAVTVGQQLRLGVHLVRGRRHRRPAHGRRVQGHGAGQGGQRLDAGVRHRRGGVAAGCGPDDQVEARRAKSVSGRGNVGEVGKEVTGRERSGRLCDGLHGQGKGDAA